MRIQVDVTLFSNQSPETNDLQLTFHVVAAADIRVIGRTYEFPGECLVENIEIDAVQLCSLQYGKFGSEWLGTEPVAAIRVQGDAARLAWLNSVLDDRDDWTDKIRAAVLREHTEAELQPA